MPELHPAEIVQILTKRIENLKRGSGNYSPSNRALAIRTASEDLANAERELAKAN